MDTVPAAQSTATSAGLQSLPGCLTEAMVLLQVIAYLAGLHHSGLWKPSLVVAPATVLRQWMNELRIWYPPLRVLLLHESGKSPYGVQRPDKAGELCAGQALLL